MHRFESPPITFDTLSNMVSTTLTLQDVFDRLPLWVGKPPAILTESERVDVQFHASTLYGQEPFQAVDLYRPTTMLASALRRFL